MLGMAVTVVGRGLWAVDGVDGRWEMMLVSMVARNFWGGQYDGRQGCWAVTMVGRSCWELGGAIQVTM